VGALLLAEVTLAIVVLCADAVGDDVARGVPARLVRAAAWPLTLLCWFHHQAWPKLARFAAIVWFLVVVGWLLTLEQDRVAHTGRFLLLAELTMAYVVACVDAVSGRGGVARRVVRSVVWVKPVAEYLCDDDAARLLRCTLVVWATLTTGWLLALVHDRLAPALPWSPG
jgi:hypothetical protein